MSSSTSALSEKRKHNNSKNEPAKRGRGRPLGSLNRNKDHSHHHHQNPYLNMKDYNNQLESQDIKLQEIKNVSLVAGVPVNVNSIINVINVRAGVSALNDEEKHFFEHFRDWAPVIDLKCVLTVLEEKRQELLSSSPSLGIKANRSSSSGSNSSDDIIR